MDNSLGFINSYINAVPRRVTSNSGDSSDDVRKLGLGIKTIYFFGINQEPEVGI